MALSLPRIADLLRHLEDLRTDTYEGATAWPDRVRRFELAAGLLNPVVSSCFGHVDRELLDGTGRIRRELRIVDSAAVARWQLSWPVPAERELPPVQVLLKFPRSSPHPHLTGTTIGSWPVQVTSAEDAHRQSAVVSTVIEAELNKRIWDFGWRAFPGYARRFSPSAVRG
ncbi:hypothetical protein [Amycolatopsis sp. cmx-4-68]|uniref:hypothetical protein n=1 Tax=Amycolatopsis sp. cmx-4-68 TaxID=2790938 RepID=UPI00397CB5B8